MPCSAGHHRFLRFFPEQVKKPDFRLPHFPPFPSSSICFRSAWSAWVMAAYYWRRSWGAMSSVFNSASTLVTLDFLQEASAAGFREAAREFWPGGNRHDGAAGLAVGPVHPLHQQANSTSTCRACRPTSAHRFPLASSWEFLWPRLNGSGAIASLLTGFVMGATRFVLEIADRASGGHFDSSAVRWLIDMNFLHYAIFHVHSMRRGGWSRSA